MKYAVLVALVGISGCTAPTDDVGSDEAAFEKGKEETCNPTVDAKPWDGGSIGVYGPNAVVFYDSYKDLPGVVFAHIVDFEKDAVVARFTMKDYQKPQFAQQAVLEDIGVTAGVPRIIGPGPPPGTWDKLDSAMINAANLLAATLSNPDYSCPVQF
jgi:hypothetical protein